MKELNALSTQHHFESWSLRLARVEVCRQKPVSAVRFWVHSSSNSSSWSEHRKFVFLSISLGMFLIVSIARTYDPSESALKTNLCLCDSVQTFVGINPMKTSQPFANTARVVNPPQRRTQNDPICMSKETPEHSHNTLAGAKRRLVTMTWEERYLSGAIIFSQKIMRD